MSTLMEELTAIKAVEDKLTANKVANFAYTDHAYNNPLTEADGVETYDVDNEQNIPVANASILKVNSTILTKGWRAQASAITRMLMNHFLGRCSYNLNKINDLFSLFLDKLMAFMGQPNGLATLDSNGILTSTELPRSNVAEENSVKPFTAGGMFDYTFGSTNANSWINKIFGHLYGRTWQLAVEVGMTAGIVYHNGLYVGANATTLKLYSSVNGKETWEEYSTLPDRTGGYFIKSMFGYLCTTGGDGTPYWSDDNGLTWNEFTGAKIYLNYTFRINNIYVSLNRTTSRLCWSEDFITWTDTSVACASNTTFKLRKFDENILFAVCKFPDYANTSVMWTEDGKNWYAGTGVPTNADGVSMQKLNEVYLIGYDSIYYSTDGKSWVQVSGTSIDANTNNIKLPAPANGYIFTSWLSNSTPKYGYTHNGINWNVGNLSPSSEALIPKEEGGLFYSAKSATYILPLQGEMYHSRDLINWTKYSDFDVSQSTFFVYYINGAFLCIYQGTVYASEDGITWYRTRDGARTIYYLNDLLLYSSNTDVQYSDITVLMRTGYFAN